MKFKETQKFEGQYLEISQHRRELCGEPSKTQPDSQGSRAMREWRVSKLTKLRSEEERRKC